MVQHRTTLRFLRTPVPTPMVGRHLRAPDAQTIDLAREYGRMSDVSRPFADQRMRALAHAAGDEGVETVPLVQAWCEGRDAAMAAA